MHIQEVTNRTGLSAHTIRFYEKTGLLPKIQRSDNGVREFTESDVTFLQFLSTLRGTAMSLQDIADFTHDGCIVERLKANDIPVESIDRRISILEQHRRKLLQKQSELESLLDAVSQKLRFYRSYLIADASEQERPS